MAEASDSGGLSANGQAARTDLIVNTDIKPNDEAERFVKAIKGWGVNGVLPNGLTIVGPKPGEINPYPSYSMQDDRMVPDVSGSIMDRNKVSEVNGVYTFVNRLAHGFNYISGENDFASGTRDLLEKNYVFIFSLSSGVVSGGDGVASFCFFQNEANLDNRYKCVELQVNFCFDEGKLKEFANFLREKSENAEVFLSRVLPGLDKRINRYKSKGLYVIESEVPDSLKASPYASMDIYSLRHYQEFLSKDATLIGYSSPVGTVDYPLPAQK
jgi:hypothetical protein